MKQLAIIPARGGSKRIPRKNIRPFLDKPIIAYSIEAALTSGLFDEVMVSTEDREIAQFAEKYGASVPFFRSIETAGDHATTVEVLLEVIGAYEKQGVTIERACCLYPTAPFITPDILKKAYRKLIAEQRDCVLSVLPFSSPIQRALKLDERGTIAMFHPEHLSTRSQDLEKAYHDAGQFYWFSVEAIKKEKKLWTENTGTIILTEMQAHDIDSEEDWKMAEFKYAYQFST